MTISKSPGAMAAAPPGCAPPTGIDNAPGATEPLPPGWYVLMIPAIEVIALSLPGVAHTWAVAVVDAKQARAKIAAQRSTQKGRLHRFGFLNNVDT